MNAWCLFVFLCLGFLCFVLSDEAESIEKGWGKDIKWQKLEEARKEAIKSNNTVMVLITKHWCGACKALRPKFADSTEIAQLSQKFLMVHLEDDEEPEGDEFRIDGRYVPRIYFLGPDGSVLRDVYNYKGKHQETKYYYGKVSEIVKSMKFALKKLDKDDTEEPETNEAEEKNRKLARGYGNKIEWMPYMEGLKEAKASNKKLVLIIHKTWCGSCKALKPKFAASDELAELSKKFVMVNVEDDEEPKGSQFVVDGEYVPRVYFMDPDGKVDETLWNEGTVHRHVKYYYGKPEELISSMQRALGKEKTGSGEKAEPQKESEPKEEEIKGDKKEKDPWWMPKKGTDGLARGFGAHITWHTYEDGLKEAKKSNKVLLLIIHKTSCASCKAIKPRIANHEEFGKLSKKFVMVNMMDDEEPSDKQLQPDGQYVPRMLFIDSNGKVMKEFWNEGTNYNHVKYFYQNSEELVESMTRVLQKFKTPAKSHGWGDAINWVNLGDAFDVAAEQKKAVMLIIHKSWCSACKALKPKFAKSQSILQHSENFVMVNVKDDDTKTDKMFDVDGAYVPRIYFVNPYTKKIMKEFYNPDPEFDDYKYAYGESSEIVRTMEKAANNGVVKGAISDRGFGNHILWMGLDEGLKQAKQTKKPVMLVLHTTWCQHSQALKPKFSSSKEIGDLSKNFVMTNLEDDEIPQDKYAVDGAYVPRIIFLDHNGQVQKQMNNSEGSEVDGADFFYNDAKQIVKTMKRMSPRYNLDNGFGKDINWITMNDGLAEARSSNMPIMLIIHKSWCGACKALKPKIANSQEILQLSKKFVMVNLPDNEEPKDDQFDVDGKYYPRVYFMDPKGKVQRDIHNTELRFLKFKFAYGEEDTVIEAMKKCLDKFQPEQPSLDHGLGKEFNWKTLDDGYTEAKKSWRPLLLVIHKSWCSACKTFKPRFSKSEKIKELSKDFVMVNVEDEFDISDKRFDIDGAYIPRVMFIDPRGNVMKDVWNTETIYKDNKYYYWDSVAVVKSMEKALDKVAVMKRKDEL